MIYDNFNRNFAFNDDPDRVFLIEIMCRKKDFHPGVFPFNSEQAQRLIKIYFIHNRKELEAKRDEIVLLCRRLGARAYILPQPRSMNKVLRELAKNTIESMGNPQVNLNSLLLRTFTAFHSSEEPRWIIDIDTDCQDREAAAHAAGLICDFLYRRGVRQITSKDFFDTPHGYHLVTSKFDSRGFAEFVNDIPWATAEIKKDNLALLYFEDHKPNEKTDLCQNLTANEIDGKIAETEQEQEHEQEKQNEVT